MFFQTLSTLSLIFGLLHGNMLISELAQGNILFQDDFTTRVGRWSYPDTAKAVVAYLDEQLHLQVISPGASISTVPDSGLDIGRYHLQADAAFTESTMDGALGVVLNYQNEANFYWFEVTPQGRFALFVIVDGKIAKRALMLGEVEASQTFTFDITVRDGVFSITLNDTELPIVENIAIKTGLFGFYARAGRESLDAAFDNLLVTTIL